MIKSIYDNKRNAQQYPKDITKIVVPRYNYIMLDADYSQIEYRVLVAMAKEPVLASMFENPDTDYHTLMASRMYGVPYATVSPKMRSDAKSFNFGIPYGMGFKSLAILLTGMSGPAQVEEAKEKYELYFKDQPNVRQFFDQVKEMALVNKYTKTYWSRYRYYSFTDKDGNTSNARRASALRQAGNAIIQGTAADIFKISVARNFMWIRREKLYGDVLITNMVHDEQLMEINCDRINTQRAAGDIIRNMQFKVNGFPTLYVGAGFGKCWADAKGKMAEMHPVLAHQLTTEAESTPLKRNDGGITQKQALDYYNDRVYKFRFNKIKDYLEDEQNHGQPLYPVIGSLLELQFSYGLDKQFSGQELTNAILAKFIEVNGLNVKPEWFSIQEKTVEEEKDDDYDDEEEFDPDDLEEGEIRGNEFALIDESDKYYGITLQDIIKEFGLMVSKERRVCGIDTTKLHYKKKDELVDFITEHQAEPDDDGAVEVVFLQESNVLFRTGVWVKGVDGSELSTRLGINALAY